MKLDIQRFAATKSTSFTESNISIPNNTSSLTIKITFSPNNTSTWFQSATLYCTCNGVQQSKKVSLPQGGSSRKVEASFTFNNIAHNNDGTKSVSWSWSCATGTSVLGTITDSGTRTLTKIPRASGMSFNPNPVELGQSVTISLTKYIEGTTDTLTWRIGDASGTIGTTDEDSYIWTPPIYLADLITTSTSGTCVISCTSYDGDTLVGTSTANLTLNVPSNIIPSGLIQSPIELNATMIALNWGVFVQNKSQIKIPVAASGSYSSTITSVVLYFGSVSNVLTGVYDSVNDVWNFTTPTIETSGQICLTAVITDSRGREYADSLNITIQSYANPTITSVEAQRCLQDGTISENGTYVLYTFVGAISSVANNNQTLFKIGYKRTTDENYTLVTIGQNATLNDQNVVSSFVISADYPYDIQFQAIDSFMSTLINRTLEVGFDLLNFNPSGKAMAIGMVSQATSNQELLEVDLPTKFYQNVECPTLTLNNNDLEDLLFYKSGDEVEFGEITNAQFFTIAGYITSSTTQLYVTLIMPKRLDKITSISVDSANLSIRGISGYINSTGGYIEYVGKSGYTLEAAKVLGREDAIAFRIMKSSAWTNITNNTPIVMQGYFKFTLT